MIYKKDTITTSPFFPYGEMPDTYAELSPKQQLALLAEQALIERMSCLQEIDELRRLLDKNNIESGSIAGWIERSDNILDKLLRYKLGKCGKLVKKQNLFMPYGWRRKFRKRFTQSI
ncbi:hypothetical protein ACG8U7_001649 [Klebsiella aerogenes]